MGAQAVLQEILSLLRWSMLAATTVGPGTVVTCSRAGAEHGLALIWALIFATFLAYILQEGAVRLTISSGKNLGQCLRQKYRFGKTFYDMALLCWTISISVYIGNTLYECNCFAGGMSAIYSLPVDGAENTVGIRVGSCFAYGAVVYGLLFWDKTELLSVGLGVVMMGMVALFLSVVIKLGIDWKRFGQGILPNIPQGSTNTVMGLIGTTSIGFNLFLSSSMAEGQSLAASQRGIGFSVFSAFLVSLLILIVGDGVTNEEGEAYTIESLAELVEEVVGTAGLWVFSLGFIAAAVSSMLTVPLGAAITVDTMYSQKREHSEEEEEKVKPPDTAQRSSIASLQSFSSLLKEVIFEDYVNRLPRWIYQGIMLSMICTSIIVVGANAKSENVIQVAQVFNGCLLPFFSICLLLCLNDPQFMSKTPQKWWSNVFLLIAVAITLFLAANVIVQNVFGNVITDEAWKFGISAFAAPAIMVATLVFTDLGREVAKTFIKRFPDQDEDTLVLIAKDIKLHKA